MESEKVKEIKKALEDNKTDHLSYIDEWKCKFVEYADILSIINELEKQNAKNANCLKQFAERLKEKYGKSCSEYYPLLLELTSEQLDETLKEFIND